MRGGCLVRRGIDDTREGSPIMSVGQRVHERAADLDLAQCQTGPSGAQTSHALEMALIRDPLPADLPPAEPLAASLRLLRPVNAKQHAAALVVFCQQDVGERNLAVYAVLRISENRDRHNANWVSGRRFDACFGAKLIDDVFCEAIEEPYEECRNLERAGW